MVEQKRTIFREKSLERLSSPERLDQLMQVISPKSWLPLLSLGSLVLVAGIWSIKGRIPITVEGRGVLIYPSKVVAIQTKDVGQLLALNVQVGDIVKKGQILGTIDQVQVRKDLQQQRDKLAELQSHNQAFGSLEQVETTKEKRAIYQQRQYLQKRILEIQTLTPVLQTKSSNSIEQQRQAIKQRFQDAQALIPILKERLKIRKYLFEKEKAIPGDMALESEQQYLDNVGKIADLRSQLKELDVKETQQDQDYLGNLNAITDLRSKLKDLDTREASLAKENLDTATVREKEIQDVKREIAKLELQLNDNSQIISQHSGRILELAIHPGQVIDTGTRLGSIEAVNPSSKLVGITYFTVADGKKIQPGMTLQITPQTVKRERFGGIVGTVTNISSFPITKESAANVVGNPEIVEGLASDKKEGLMQVYADLKFDSATFTGYQWSSSKGPQLKISPGTTTTVRVKVEERAPITFVLPILRSTSGIY